MKREAAIRMPESGASDASGKRPSLSDAFLVGAKSTFNVSIPNLITLGTET